MTLLRCLRVQIKKSISWLLRGSEAVTIQDKFLLFIVKITYLGLRSTLRVTLGTEKRDHLFIKHDLDFASL